MGIFDKKGLSEQGLPEGILDVLEEDTAIVEIPEPTQTAVETPKPVQQVVVDGGISMKEVQAIVNTAIKNERARSAKSNGISDLVVTNTDKAQAALYVENTSELIKKYTSLMREHFEEEMNDPKKRIENVIFPRVYGKTYGGDAIPVGGNGWIIYIPLGVKLDRVPISLYNRIENSYLNATSPASAIGNTKGKFGVDESVARSGDGTEVTDSFIKTMMSDAASLAQ